MAVGAAPLSAAQTRLAVARTDAEVRTKRWSHGGGSRILALTGAATGTIAGGSALLLAVGTALFVAACRRKTRFTA